MPEIKFCPYCGHTVLFITTTVRCHGCGEDFAVKQNDAMYAQEFLKELKQCVQELLQGNADLTDLKRAV